MESIRWKKFADTYYLPMQQDNLTCMPDGNYSGECYPKHDADAVIVRLEHQIEVLNADLTRCQDSKAAIGDKCLRLEDAVERCHKLALGILNGKEDISKIQDIERILRALSGGR